MPFGPFIVSFFITGFVNFIFTVAGVSLPIYETTYSGARGWTTSLWRSCLKSETGSCKTIDESNLRCEELGHMLRGARAFCVLAILALAFQCAIAVAYIANFYKPTSRFPFIVTAAINFVLLLVGLVMTLSLYSEKQCSQSLKSADEMNFIKLSVGPPLLVVASVFELSLFFATLLWPTKWAEVSGDALIFTGQDFEVIEAERKEREKKYNVSKESKADAANVKEGKDDEKKKDK